MAQKPGIPKGTRDFSSTEVQKRNYIFNVIKKAFQLYGFQPIETPSFENSSTLMGKYGEEGDRLIFKILNSGDYLKKADSTILENKESNKLTSSISEKALRYDLTVPFARYVVQHQNEITLPFKRYQIQPVWRADRPQKGRFREFYQCDADVIGSTALVQEMEFIQLYDTVFTNLGLSDVEIKLNNRKILAGFAEVIQAEDKLIEFTVALDKLDKIGKEKVIEEMLSKGISADAIIKIDPLFSFTGTNAEKIEKLKTILAESEIGLKGIAELEEITQNIAQIGLQTATLSIDVTLARGLNYYTGAIFEVVTNAVSIGSIGGGGRYDDLTSIFGLKDMSGVGISFGLDRIYIVLEELGLFNEILPLRPTVLLLNYLEETKLQKMKIMTQLRRNNVSTEVYPDVATSNKKQQKQFKYVKSREIPFMIMDNNEDLISLKNVETNEVTTGNLEQIISVLTN